MAKLLTRPQLQCRLAANPSVVLVEALPERYYSDWHLPGAKHMPHDQVTAVAPSLFTHRDAEIVVYCANANCQNSTTAAQLLEQMGYTNVSVYQGGKQDWREAGLPIEKSEAITTG